MDKIFEVGEGIKIECGWKKTRNGFKHMAQLFVNGALMNETKICYLNRTWESYEYQSVAIKVVEGCKGLTHRQRGIALTFLNGYKDEGMFNSLKLAVALGGLICNTQEEKNDWNKRMLKASLGEAVDFPEDWDQLPEEEKTRRLSGALGVLK